MTFLAWRGLSPLQSLAAIIGIAIVALGVIGAAGFGWFIHLATQSATLPRHADGIVALTGGAERVETALRLLASGKADKLLLSGIGGGAELSELAHLAGVESAPLATRVTLGRTATSTRGNAQETAAWAQANDIHSLIVVTAYYHMPRALAELGRMLPAVTLYPLPVMPPERSGHGVSARLIAEEYAKYVATTLGLTAMVPPREVAPAHGNRAG